MSELDREIKEALNKDVDLTEQQYKDKVIKADEVTAGHGATKKAPVSEALRHKRIQSNFYGVSLNFLASLLNEMSTQTNLLVQQNTMLYALCKEKNIDVDKLFRANE